MRIDWIVAVVIFLMFTIWAFAYHSMLNAAKIVSMSESAILAGERITDYMKVQISSMPANFSSGSEYDNVTLFTYMNWTGNIQNSTRVVKGKLSYESLPCMISGDKLYWNSSLAIGNNFFYIQYADLNTSLNCNKAIQQYDKNQTTLWAVETRDMFSSVKNSQICSRMNSSYSEMKSEIGITFDFNVLIETEGTSMACGSKIPASFREVFGYPATGALFEGGEINISVRLWL
jgi:hypothetical protein